MPRSRRLFVPTATSLFVLALAFALGACGDDSEENVQTDSGTNPDGTTPYVDGGHHDATDSSDAGNQEDSTVTDSGDAGSSSDANDSGTTTDTGAPDVNEAGPVDASDSGSLDDGGDGGDAGGDGGIVVDAGDGGVDAGVDASDGGGEAGACVTIDMTLIDAGTAGVCAGGLGCTAQPVDTFSPTWKAPTGKKQALCTTAQMAGYFAACFGDFADLTSCNTFTENAANAACLACMVTPEIASSYGPMILMDGFYSLNIPGCVALLEPCNTECAQALQAGTQCGNASCETGCPVTDAFSLFDYQFCTEDSAAACCSVYANEATCANDISGNPSHAASACFNGATFQDLFQTIVPLFCGP